VTRDNQRVTQKVTVLQKSILLAEHCMSQKKQSRPRHSQLMNNFGNSNIHSLFSK